MGLRTCIYPFGTQGRLFNVSRGPSITVKGLSLVHHHHPQTFAPSNLENQMKSEHEHPNAELLQSATKGFDYLFSNDIVAARQHFERRDDPFHLMGLGVCAFLEAALGMEVSIH